MTAPAPDEQVPHDPIEDIARHIPIVLPLAGAITIFLLAFIAVHMA